LKGRRHALVHDAAGNRVGDPSFEAIADLDAHAAIVLGDDDDQAVVRSLAADLPGSARRMPNCSMVSGSVVGSSSTATCALPGAVDGGELRL
jgi:hypothetical protein